MPLPLFPRPKHAEWLDGALRLTSPATEPLSPGDLPALLPAGSFQVVPDADWAWAPEAADRRTECYELRVGVEGVDARAFTAEGLMRAEATLLQLAQTTSDGVQIPACCIRDWPDFRYRCASDWLLNCEINRWSYDWGDGPEATLARLKRKLDFCFAHKINQVWFDGLGWSVSRGETLGPDYSAYVRECNRYARARGIRLTFAGYGGGYGTSYQKSELYRCGYQGQVFHNRRPWPDGPLYDCTGCDVPESRALGTCPSNEELKAAKIADMRRFVEAAEPGFMYIHDVDTGTFAASHQSWLWRCQECRQRWPSDEMADPQGQAGAYAEWFRQVAEGLHSVHSEGYNAAEDLVVVFTSPLYTSCDEPGQPELWDHEVEYFRLLSTLIGPHSNVMFGFREQFYRADGSRKIAQLRAALDSVGHGHGIHVIAFGGGDNYTSDDLYNISAATAPIYRGAHSVCVSNGGVHEEPVQVLNAEFLWNSAADGFCLNPGSDAELLGIWQKLLRGHWRPDELCGPGGTFEAICRHLWGDEAGPLLHEARLLGGDGVNGPVAHVWWSVTREVRRLTGEYTPWNDQVSFEELAQRWTRRAAVTSEALKLATEALELRPDEDIAWFAASLQVGLGFARVLAAAYTSPEDRSEALRLLAELEAHVHTNHSLTRTDFLGGDPGCWQETIDSLRRCFS